MTTKYKIWEKRVEGFEERINECTQPEEVIKISEEILILLGSGQSAPVNTKENFSEIDSFAKII